MSEEAVQQDGDFKVKKSSMKKFNKEPETIKVDLSAKKHQLRQM